MDVKQTLTNIAGRILRPLRAGDRKLASSRESAPRHAIQMTSPKLAPNARVPDEHAGPDGRSPALRWSGVPAGARELVLIMEDPDAPSPQPFVHWTVYGIPPIVTEVDEGVPPSSVPLASGATQGRNSMGGYGYVGPQPPPGHGVHHYHFQLFALDQRLDLKAPVDRDQLIKAMRGRVLATGELVSTYER
jgi:Raf kinase inhibitor-like YbhB/YbcL family protein